MSLLDSTQPPLGDASSEPPPARVANNRWTELQPPELGGWHPSERVTVVIPAFEDPHALELTAAGLVGQTYPRELLEIVIVDDGSEPPLSLPRALDGFDARVVRQENTGFGAGRGRNRGAEEATGTILVFLDADTIPEPQLVEAHAVWHHTVADAVTLGFRTHVDVEGIDSAAITAASRAGSFDRLFDGRDQWRAEWIDRFLERTGELTADRHDLFKIVTGCNLGVRARTFGAIGGMRILGVRGVEDTQLGYRLFAHGALLVPERRAGSWHQGASHFQGEERERTRYQRVPVMANYIPLGGFRAFGSKRIFAVPACAVMVPVVRHSGEMVVKACESLLDGDFADLEIAVVLPPDYQELDYIERAFVSDPRVRIVSDDADLVPPAETPFRVTWPPDAIAGPKTLAEALKTLTKERLGALHVTVPGGDAESALAHVRMAPAVERSNRVAATSGEDPEEVLAQLFGERWVPGYDLGVTRNWRRFCPVCEDEVEAFAAGDSNRCPLCGATASDRLGWLFLMRETTLRSGGLLRVAVTDTSSVLAEQIGAVEGVELVTTTPAELVTNQEPQSFDCIYAPNLLAESDGLGDWQAGVATVLRPGGWALFEAAGDGKAAELVNETLGDAGFAVKTVDYSQRLGGAWADRYGVPAGRWLHYSQKAGGLE